MTRWIDRGEDAPFLDGLPLEYERRADTNRMATADPLLVSPVQEVPSAPLAVEDRRRSADEEPHYWVSEDQLLQFDHQRFSDWLGSDGDRFGWRQYTNQSRTQRLLVYYANLTPIEHTLGVDLLYHHEGHGCYVLVQYKKLAIEKGGTEWGYRPDKNLRGQLDRMRDIDDLCRSIEQERKVSEFRLLPTPCMVKLCEPQSLIMDSSEWVPGMYLAREQFESALTAPTSKGPRGGVRLTYNNVERYPQRDNLFDAAQGWLDRQPRRGNRAYQGNCRTKPRHRPGRHGRHPRYDQAAGKPIGPARQMVSRPLTKAAA